MLIAGAVIALPVAGVSAGKFWCHLHVLSAGSERRLSLFRSLYAESDAMRALGKLYLERTNSTALASLCRLEGENQIARAIDSECRMTTISAIERSCCNDFRCGRVHVVAGWVLAQTELDVAALYTIG